MRVVVERCAFLDVHRDTVMACARTPTTSGSPPNGTPCVRLRATMFHAGTTDTPPRLRPRRPPVGRSATTVARQANLASQPGPDAAIPRSHRWCSSAPRPPGLRARCRLPPSCRSGRRAARATRVRQQWPPTLQDPAPGHSGRDRVHHRPPRATERPATGSRAPRGDARGRRLNRLHRPDDRHGQRRRDPSPQPGRVGLRRPDGAACNVPYGAPDALLWHRGALA